MATLLMVVLPVRKPTSSGYFFCTSAATASRSFSTVAFLASLVARVGVRGILPLLSSSPARPGRAARHATTTRTAAARRRTRWDVLTVLPPSFFPRPVGRPDHPFGSRLPFVRADDLDVV